MSLNPFPVTDLQSEVELMQWLCRHCRVWNTRHWTDSEFAWMLSCSYLSNILTTNLFTSAKPNRVQLYIFTGVH